VACSAFTSGLRFAGKVGQEGSVSPRHTRALPALPGQQAWQLPALSQLQGGSAVSKDVQELVQTKQHLSSL